MQKKTEQVSVPIEPIFLKLINKIDSGNTAQYFRDLAIKDLATRQLITEDVMKELFEIESHVNSQAV